MSKKRGFTYIFLGWAFIEAFVLLMYPEYFLEKLELSMAYGSKLGSEGTEHLLKWL